MANDIVAAIRKDLTVSLPEIAKVLPSHISPERFERVAMTAIQREPALARCDRKSILESCMRCATDGLIPDGREAALVVFGDKATYMPMVAGIIKKMHQSGEVGTFTAQIIYANDEYDFWIDDTGEHIRHRPCIKGERGEIVSAYAMLRTKDGQTYVEMKTKAEIEKVRNASRAKNGGPWRDWWPEMAKKTVTRALSKRVPISAELETVIRRDDQFYDFDGDTGPRVATGDKKGGSLIDKVNAEIKASDEDTDIIEGEATEIPAHDATTGEIIDAEAETIPQPANDAAAKAAYKRILAAINGATADSISGLMLAEREAIDALPQGGQDALFIAAGNHGWTGFVAQAAAE